ncbi:MAG TPA: hypothetical protein VF590_25350, partial [Isosphaeraceae bacterium]
CGREQARWAASPERVRLLRTWVTGRRPEDDAQWIVPRLDLIAQHPLGLDRLVLLKVLQGAADNPGFPVEFRPRAIIAMGWLARDGDSEVIEAVFRTLVAYVRDAPEHQVQRQAAGVLTRVPLTRARSTLIRELWGRVDDAVIRDTLQEALGDAGRG